MINAEIVPQSENLFFVRFSDPNEEFGNKPFIPVPSMEEAKRRMYFRNRAYVLEKMRAWLKQREHAVPQYRYDVSMLLGWLKDIENSSFFHLCDFIKRKRMNIERLAPNETSTHHRYYVETILPILDFCTGQNLEDNDSNNIQR